MFDFVFRFHYIKNKIDPFINWLTFSQVFFKSTGKLIFFMK